jgi:hypothetical protein
MTPVPPADAPQRHANHPHSVIARALGWGRLILLLGLWATAISAASHLGRVTGPISFSLCGPWGCTGPTEALLACHAVWLLVLLPPGVAAGLRLPLDDARRCANALVGAGLAGTAIVFAWGSIGWLLHASATRSLWLHRGLFVLVDQSDIPVVQILLSGVGCLVAVHLRKRTDRASGSEFGCETAAGRDASRPASAGSHSGH